MRCPECGSKECCGGEMSEKIDRLENKNNDLATLRAQDRQWLKRIESRLLKQLESHPNQWIAVEDRLPEYGEPVLLVVVFTNEYGAPSGKSVVNGYRKHTDMSGEGFVIGDGFSPDRVVYGATKTNTHSTHTTHWMPLPEPPEGE